MTIWQVTLAILLVLLGLGYLEIYTTPAILLGILAIVAGIAVGVGK